MLVVLLLLVISLADAETFRVASYNVEGYLDLPLPGRPVKSAESRAQVRKSIQAIKPDVLALQEVGSTSALAELQASLKSEGLDLPNWEFVTGTDTNIHVAILSRFPFTARQQHTNLSFLLGGRRFHVSRGFSEVDIRVTSNYGFTLITAHLKSRRAVPQADEAELRLEEAKLLREKIDARLNENPKINLVVLGDLNDTKDSPPIKVIIGRGRSKLLDTRPAESSGATTVESDAADELRIVNWTHYYSKEDTYGRIDYVLLSPGMAREWSRSGTFVLASPGWGLASDHRPIVAEFEAEER
jgi:endonuclease/exonuclease/phosphatase family metal-dependent hydrolase